MQCLGRGSQANNTSIAEKGIIALCTTLAEHNRTVRALQLDAPLLQRPQHDTATHLARALSANAMLSEVSLAKHGMVDSCLEVLVQFGLTAKGCAVSALSLRCNRLSPLAGAWKLFCEQHRRGHNTVAQLCVHHVMQVLLIQPFLFTTMHAVAFMTRPNKHALPNSRHTWSPTALVMQHLTSKQLQHLH